VRLQFSKVAEQKLDEQEVSVFAAHLRENHPDTFKEIGGVEIPAEKIKKLITESTVLELKPSDKPLYRRDKVDTCCTVVVNGKITIKSGRDGERTFFLVLFFYSPVVIFAGFKSESGAWAVLGADCLTADVYRPDFTAIVTEKARCLRITKAAFTRYCVDDLAVIQEDAGGGAAAEEGAISAGELEQKLLEQKEV
jgi:hypothetical protein